MRTTVTTLDTLGHTVREEIPGVTPTDYTYGPHGLLTKVTQGSRVTMLAYGTDGFVQSETDALCQRLLVCQPRSVPGLHGRDAVPQKTQRVFRERAYHYPRTCTAEVQAYG